LFLMGAGGEMETINAASRERIVARTITIGVCVVLGWLFVSAWLARRGRLHDF
jgi:hypothetical protein